MLDVFPRAWRSAGSGRFRPLLTLALWYLLLGLLLRVVLWLAFGRAQQVSALTLPAILVSGAVADAVQSLYLLAPFAIFLWLTPDRLYRSRAMRGTLLAGALVWMFCLTFVAAIEYYFFEEFDARLNLVAVDYLLYPTEVVGDIWTEYPVATVVCLAAGSSAAVAYALRRWLLPRPEDTSRFAQRSAVFAAFAVLTVICASSFETHALGFSANRITNEIAANGASSFFRALRTNEIDYHTYYASRPTQANIKALVSQLSAAGGGKFTRLAEGRLDRTFPEDPRGLGRLNVVVVASESFGAEFSKLYGSKRDWTPQFDSYAKQGVWFRHMYASGTRTVRGLEAIATSLPPIPSVSVLRRPGNEGIANWGTVMRAHGYRTSFLYGGYGYFDN
jgi:phosphoglycerol transferase MdoB-like AlkP superfamily enzyme